MKVLFWSPVHGQSGTTSNILAVSLLIGMYYKKKILLTQTHFSYNNLEAPLVGNNSNNKSSKESQEYFLDVGLDALVRCFKASKLDNDTLENCCISLENTNLLLLPGTTKTNRESFEYEMDIVMKNLLRAIEEIYGIVFVDISSGYNPISFKLMKEADLTVVNLSQNMGITDMFFNEMRESMPDNLFYLFGNYDCNSKHNINNIRRKYKEIKAKNSGVIPYNTSFMDALCDCEVIEYIRNNINCSKNDENAYFIMKAVKATEKIINLATKKSGATERT